MDMAAILQARGLGRFGLVIISSCSVLGAVTHTAFAEDVQVGIEGDDDGNVIAVDDALDVYAIEAALFGGTAKADATGVDGKENDDAITLNAESSVDAETDVLLLIQPKKAEANSAATGVKGGDDNDTITNNTVLYTTATGVGAYGAALNVDSDDTDNTPSNKETIDVTVKSKSTASGLAGGDGDDALTNNDVLDTAANSAVGGAAFTLNAEVTKSLSIETNSEAESAAKGIDAGKGSDTATNTGQIITSAGSLAGALGAGVVAGDENTKTQISMEASAKATSTATGIATDADDTESETDFSTPLDGGGLAVGSETITTTTASTETVINNDELMTTANATAGAGAVGIAAEVNGTVKSKANAEATATGTGVVTGGGDDVISNTGALTTSADASADTLGVALGIGDTSSPDKKNKTESEANAKAVATATGINSEGDGKDKTTTIATELTDGNLVSSYSVNTQAQQGNDTVTNEGSLDSQAYATSDNKSLGVEVGTSGSTKSESKSTAQASSTGIVTGAGDDDVENSGIVSSLADADASSTSLSLAIAQEADEQPPSTQSNNHKLASSSDASAEATARSTGIDAEGINHNTSTLVDTSIGADGLAVTYTGTKSALSGNDTLTNSGAVSSSANASADSLNISLEIDAVGAVKSKANATAKADSDGLVTGSGNDIIDNTATIASDATALAESLAIALTVTETSETDDNTKPPKGKTSSENKATATAKATGIDAEGSEHETTTVVAVDISGDGLEVGFQRTVESLVGNDEVDSNADILVTSDATSRNVAGGISIGTAGTASVDAKSTASATSDGIASGGGDDEITAAGTITALADANSSALVVSFAQGEKAKSKADAQSESTATARGIQADGVDTDSDLQVNLLIGDEGLAFALDYSASSGAGADTVTNAAAIVATADADSGVAGGAVGIDGSASSDLKSTAKARAEGISTGGGEDTVIHSAAGSLLVDADATSGALSIAFGQKEGEKTNTKVQADAKAEAVSTASGIATDNGTAERIIDADLVIDAEGLDTGFSYTEKVFSDADVVVSQGSVDTNARSLAGATGVTVTIDGAAKSDVSAVATSSAGGVDTGGGDDYIFTSDQIDTTAASTSGALTVGYGQKTGEKAKPKVQVEASSTATSTATGIAADSGKDSEVSASLDINDNGLFVDFTLNQDAAVGDDDIAVGGNVSADANSLAGAVGGVAAIDGAAKAETKSTAVATATGIVAGGGNDTVKIGCDVEAVGDCAVGVAADGEISATADANAVTLTVGVGVKSSDSSKAKTAISAETESTAMAVGIAADGGEGDRDIGVATSITDDGIDVDVTWSKAAVSGDDTVDNFYDVNSDATARTGAVSTGVTVKGSGSSKMESTAKSLAKGLDSGGGADSIENYGDFTVASDSFAATANVTVSTEGSAISNSGLLGAGTTAESTAIGISSGGSVADTSTTITTDIAFDSFDISATYESIIDSLSGDANDTIYNSGSVFAESDTLTPDLAVAVSTKGVAAAIGRTKSTSDSAGIQSGNGSDVITNDGVVNADSAAKAYTANVAYTSKGLAVAGNSVWDGGTESKATANGIDADNGSLKTTSVIAGVSSDGAQIVYLDTLTAASGDDTVTNTGTVGAHADAQALTSSVAVSPKGVAAAVSTSGAEAEANAIRGGAGADTITNSGLLASDADALAISANVAVVNKGVAAAADAVWDGGTKATANATGIAGDGGDINSATRLAVGTDEMGYEKTSELADGSDTIDNSGSIYTDASSNAGSLGVAVAVQGVGIATSTATSNATAKAIDAGAGDAIDDVYNSGELNSTATATAEVASVSVTNKGLAISSDSVWDGGTKATASARGIDVGAGGETITNDGDVTTGAVAGVVSAGVAVTMSGVAGATATATGTADAIAIDASAGDDTDTITNNGNLTVDADAGAAAASVSVVNAGLSIAAGAVWDGGTGADANATGIDVGAGADRIDNHGDVAVSSLSGAAEAAVGVAVSGVAGAIATSTSESTAAAIRAGDNDDNAIDEVVNTGDLSATADAGGVSAAVSFTNAGVGVAGGAVWDGGTKSIADAKGLELGGGADRVNNSGDISADSLSAVAELAAAISMSGVAGATATSTGTSYATAIDMGSDNSVDTVLNSGDLSATSDAGAVSAAVSVTNAGLAVAGGAVWDGGTKGIAEARGIYLGAGDEADGDIVENSGDITATSIGITAEMAASVSVAGVAGAIATSSGTSKAFAIDASEGDDADSIINSGDLTADSTAGAATTTVAVTNAGLAVASGAVWDGGTTATSDSYGIATGDGVDTVDNTGDVAAISRSGAAELGVSVAVSGVAGAIATSTSDSSATAIDVGETAADADTVINTGKLTADSDAVAATATVSVTTAGVAVSGGAIWEGGTKANSEARGIEAGEGADTISNEGDMDIDSSAIAAEATVPVSVWGVAGGVATATSDSDASAIDTGDGDDIDYVYNSGDLDVFSHSLAASAAVSVTVGGVAVTANDIWDGGTTALSSARGIEVGDGADTIDNVGDITSEAWAESAAANVSVAVWGVGAATATSTVEADSTGIDAGAGEFDDVVNNTGDVAADSTGITISAAASYTTGGVAGSSGSIWDGGTRSATRSNGITTGAGNDTVFSDGRVSADTDSSATGGSAAVGIFGVAGAIASANSTGDSVGIDVADGDDTVESRDNITVSSLANANSIGISVNIFGVAGAAGTVWDGGAKSASTSTGINAGDGLDGIFNSADMDIDALSVSTSSTLSFTVGGVAASIATSTADADAYGINAGTGDDRIENFGNLAVDSDANAVSANVAIAAIGVALASDSIWDGGTTANSNAFGLAGGTGNDVILSGDTSSSVVPLAVDLNTIDVTANSLISSNSLSVSGIGITSATTTGTANADARGIAAGDGDDIVVSASDITSTADALGVSAAVSLSTIAAAAGDAFWDGGTKGNANSAGIDGGDGVDELYNLGSVTADAEADTVSVAVAFSGILTGATAASTADAVATGMDGASGADILASSGDVNANAAAHAEGVSVSISMGAAVAGAPLDATTAAIATATGLAGGEDIDGLNNEATGNMTVTSEARARETQVALGGLLSAALANTSATATSVGFDGGDADDLMMNSGSVTQTSDARSISRSISVTLAGGVAAADAKATTNANNIGFNGGTGNDQMVNAGAMDLHSTASTIGQAVSVGAAGVTYSNANAESHADATGMSGATGDDEIVNEGDLVLSSDAGAEVVAVSATQIGFSLAAADALAASDLAGINGDEGQDTVRNAGLIDIDAVVHADAVAVSATLGGASIGSANTTTDTYIAGIAGGDDNDILINDAMGAIELQSNAELQATGVSITLGGYANAEATTFVYSDINGMNGDAGDDEVLNKGSIDVRSQSLSTANGVSVSLLGAAVGKADTQAETTVAGMAGGAGADTLINYSTGAITVGAVGDQGDDAWMSILRGGATAAALAGGSISEASAVASTISSGISGGADDDAISNQGNVSVVANALNETGSDSYTIFGSSEAAGNSGATTLATGLAGGAGNDYVESLNVLDVSSAARLIHSSTSLTFAGAADAQSLLAADSEAIGIAGGEGDDVLLAEGIVDVNASSYMHSASGAGTLFGSSQAGGNSGALTTATGLAGGLGNDFIESRATMDVSATAELVHNSSSFTFGGAAGATGTLEANTLGNGITGGDGDDTVLTSGNISVASESQMRTTSGAGAAFGASTATGVVGATTKIVAIDTGAGDDWVESAAAMNLTALSNLSLASGAISFAGSGSAGGTLAALTGIEVFQAGDGNDYISNSGAVVARGDSTMTAGAGAGAVFGSSAAAITSGGRSVVNGFLGGEGNDVLENTATGSLDVAAYTTVSGTSNTYTVGGAADSAVTLKGVATAAAMQGGSGNDELRNFGDIKVLADSSLSSSGGSEAVLTATGGVDAAGISVTEAFAYGLDAGFGNDIVDSSGTLSVLARGTSEVFNNGDNIASFSSTSGAASTSRAYANAFGVKSEGDSNEVYLDGRVDIGAEAVAYALATASGAEISFDGNGAANATATAEATATGVSTGSGNDLVVNNSEFSVDAYATTSKEVTTDILVYRLIGEGGEGDTPADVDEFVNLPALDPATSPYSPGTLAISAGDYHIVRDRYVDDDNDPDTALVLEWYWDVADRVERVVEKVSLGEFSTYAFGNGNGFPVGDGAATVKTTTVARAMGVELGDGNDRFENHDSFTVSARAKSIGTGGSDGDSSGDADTVARARASAYATGISLGDGNDELFNTGDISVTASPVAQAKAQASGGDYCIWFFGWHCGLGGVGTATTDYDSVAVATGIEAGTGDLLIINDGTLTVAAQPDLNVDTAPNPDYDYPVRNEGADAGRNNYDLDYTAKAYGIKADDAGDATIINNGEIIVSAYDLRYLCNTQTCLNVTSNLQGSTTQTLEAIGIQTGAGNDEVINNGVITALLYREVGGAFSQTAINTGGGNDRVQLGDLSVTTGTVLMGDGDDTLVLAGTPILQNQSGGLIAPNFGSGIASLELIGDGYFANNLNAVSRTSKYEEGTYRLPTLVSQQSITVDAGAIQLDSGYNFAASGAYSTFVHSDLSSGQLLVGGNATLDGAIDIERRGGSFISDGTRYLVVESDGAMSGSFAAVTLPEAKPLLSFALEEDLENGEVDVVATAASFDSVVDAPVVSRVGANMDGLSRSARSSGKMNEVLGAIQQMDGGFEEVFASNSPEVHSNATAATFANGQQMAQLVSNHLGAARAGYRRPSQSSATPGVSWSYDNNGLGYVGFTTNKSLSSNPDNMLLAANGGNYVAPDRPQKRYSRNAQVWGMAAVSKGDYDSIDGFSGFDSDSTAFTLGADFRGGEQWLFGATLGLVDTTIKTDDMGSRVDADSWYAGAYGSWFSSKAYVEASLSFANQDFDTARLVMNGMTDQTATADYSGDSWQAYAATGYEFGRGNAYLEPYGALYYFQVYQEEFAETGAGALNQVVESRRTKALFGEVGANFTYEQQLQDASLDWSLKLGYNYDFSIDGGAISYGYEGSPGNTFQLDDRAFSDNSMRLGAGVAYNTGRTTFSLEYTGLWNSDYKINGAAARLNFRF